jgi:MarR family transcriptional regulator, lower aerobic nicotinate degradation pathway regulator
MPPGEIVERRFAEADDAMLGRLVTPVAGEERPSDRRVVPSDSTPQNHSYASDCRLLDRGCRRGASGGLPSALVSPPSYRLDEQIGFLLRRAHQRHAAIFHEHMLDGLTPTQFAALAKLREGGPLPQNQLGRETAMDTATINGVVTRLKARGLVERVPDTADRRRLTVKLTPDGRRLVDRCIKVAARISELTLAPLDDQDRGAVIELLDRIADPES